jgi:GAF domain-containing protein
MNTDPSVTELTTVFARLQGMLLSQEAATSAVHQLAELARDLIPSAAGAGASVLEEGGTGITTAATDQVVDAADALQHELGEGPCLSAWATALPQRLDDTTTDTHWPAWSAAVAGLGVRSVLSTPLIFQADVLGAMKVYTTTAHAFGAADEHRLRLLATAAATLLAAGQTPEAPHQLSATLQTTFSDRQAVDVATGILMERRDLTQQEARHLLLETARAGNRPLLEIAREVLERTTDPTTDPTG